MVGSALAFTAYLVLAKQLSARHDPGFLAFWRAAIGVIVMAPMLLRPDASTVFQVTRPLTLVARSILGSLGFMLSLYAVSEQFSLPLAQFNAISFSRALFVTILAALFLGERVGRYRWSAVGVGFLGVLIMVMPGAVFFWVEDLPRDLSLDTGTWLAIASALSLAGAIVLVKSLSATHRPSALLIWANFLSTLFLAPFLFITFSTPNAGDWMMIIGMALAGLAAQFCYVSAMAIGDASFLSPMDYLRLPIAALADWLIFRVFPGPFVWIGASIIISSTLFIAVRERLRGAALASRAGHRQDKRA